jgi:hypothetical protein
MFKKLGRVFWGLALLPFALSTLYHLPRTGLGLISEVNLLILLFAGAVLYFLFEVLFSRPMRTYVFGHELTHALASMAMGGNVLSFNVSQRGGSVSLSKSNFFVALAPYCIPIYTLIVFLIYFVLTFFYPADKMQTVFLILAGFSLAFHGSLTLYAIQQEQPDIQKTGTFFSLVFILLLNSWVLVLLSKVLFWNSISLKGFFLETMKTQVLIWKWIGKETLTFFRK